MSRYIGRPEGLTMHNGMGCGMCAEAIRDATLTTDRDAVALVLGLPVYSSDYSALGTEEWAGVGDQIASGIGQAWGAVKAFAGIKPDQPKGAGTNWTPILLAGAAALAAGYFIFRR